MENSFNNVKREIEKAVFEKEISKQQKLQRLKEAESELEEILEYKKKLAEKKLALFKYINKVQKQTIDKELRFRDNKLKEMIDCIVSNRPEGDSVGSI